MNLPQIPHYCKTDVTSSVFCQDNLELLKSQPDESVDLIYCDILYGTGRNFGDYQDLKPIRSEIEAHYLPRLKEMHRVLKSTGSIYLQMDTRINHWMRILMDDVFGYANFRNEIVWCYNGGGVTKKKWNSKHDVILFYTKINSFNFNTQYQPYKENSANRLSNSHNNKKTLEEIERGTPMVDWWNDVKAIVNPDNKEYVKYVTQKPNTLIERIIKASSNEGDVVADYYLGSGTTAVVCKELNRNFIGCDINPKAIEITKNRLYGTGTC
jgi:site-specific DNA-methyltransferase (adenine-specific)